MNITLPAVSALRSPQDGPQSRTMAPLHVPVLYIVVDQREVVHQLYGGCGGQSGIPWRRRQPGRREGAALGAAVCLRRHAWGCRLYRTSPCDSAVRYMERCSAGESLLGEALSTRSRYSERTEGRSTEEAGSKRPVSAIFSVFVENSGGVENAF